MRKISFIIFFIILLLLSTACGNTTDTDSDSSDSKIVTQLKERYPETLKVLKKEERYYRNIFTNIENGAYADAEELIQKNIMGNIEKEKDAARISSIYSDALYNDFNTGLVSEEKISTICQTAA